MGKTIVEITEQIVWSFSQTYNRDTSKYRICLHGLRVLSTCTSMKKVEFLLLSTFSVSTGHTVCWAGLYPKSLDVSDTLMNLFAMQKAADVICWMRWAKFQQAYLFHLQPVTHVYMHTSREFLFPHLQWLLLLLWLIFVVWACCLKWCMAWKLWRAAAESLSVGHSY